jgi:hypothetical protein
MGIRFSISQYFQIKCRKHFVNCREDLHQVLSLSFNYKNAGDVVRPVYQHAIIPSYLQGPFAEWLVNNSEVLLQYSAKQLPLILHNEKSLDYMPQRLRDFIRSEETKETAARLITRMSNAIKLFHESEQSEAVESVMSSSIERSLWKVIYKKLINDQSQLVKLRRITPLLEWYWDLEDEEIILHLSNIRSGRSDKPDSVTWAKKDAKYLKGNDILVKVFPWRMRSGDWEVDPVRIPADGPLDGSILVLSEDFDLDEDKQNQGSHIIFERNVPLLQKPIMFFRVNPRRDIAVQKDRSILMAHGLSLLVSMFRLQTTPEIMFKHVPRTYLTVCRNPDLPKQECTVFNCQLRSILAKKLFCLKVLKINRRSIHFSEGRKKFQGFQRIFLLFSFHRMSISCFLLTQISTT